MNGGYNSCFVSERPSVDVNVVRTYRLLFLLL